MVEENNIELLVGKLRNLRKRMEIKNHSPSQPQHLKPSEFIALQTTHRKIIAHHQRAWAAHHRRQG